MKRDFSMALATLFFLAQGAAGHAAQAEAAPASCPGADAWQTAHPEQLDAAIDLRDAGRTFTEPALRQELARRVERDQQWRARWLKFRSSDADGRVAMTDAENLTWLRDLVREKGFPTAQQVGERGVSDAWLLAHHASADPRFQASLLLVLEKRHADGEFGASDLARFADRVLVSQSLPQWYGTQMSPQKWLTDHYGLPDQQSVRDTDARRKALGLMPLADYVCMMVLARTGKAPPLRTAPPGG